MKYNTWITVCLSIVVISLILALYLFIWPAASRIYSLGKIDKTEVAHRDNYKLHTTPLSPAVVDDLCLRLNLNDTSEQCKPGVTVYAPELFDELKTYFKNLPQQDKTYDTVQEKLGSYLVFCGPPDHAGFFSCKYDFRGDKVYPIFFDFDKQGFYYEITANTGGDS